MSRTILIDGNAIGYAGQHLARLENNGKPVQAIFHFLKSMMKFKRLYPNDKILVLWDCKAQWRLDLYPEYKSTRKKTEQQRQDREEYAEQRPVIRHLLPLLGIYQVEAENWEADDLSGFFVRLCIKRGDEVILITGDEDWAQHVDRPTIMWYDPRNNGKWITYATFTAMTSAPNTYAFLSMKAMQGDTSDAIDGIEKLGEKAAANIIESFGSISELYRDHDAKGGFDKSNVPPGFNTRFMKPLNRLCSQEGKDKLARNLKLMNLKSTSKDDDIKKVIVVRPGKRDLDAFFSRCLDLDFNSVTSRPEMWRKTFGEQV